jgi:hypothetical protein
VNRYKAGARVKVRLGGRTRTGTVIKHHPTLPAWVISVGGKRALAFLYSEIVA